jgi:RHS repeat-associated protein
MDDGSDEWDYTYDYENRLIKVLKNDVLLNRYFYGADGRRVKVVDSQGGSLIHIYSGLNVVYEKTVSSTMKHYYANGLHIAENRSGTLEYYHQDHLGSTRLKTDSNGNSIYDTNYMPFGPVHEESGSEEFKYTGKHEDPSGLYYFGARYYDPKTGRFITEDPVTGSLDDPQGLNRYSYCKNNPHKYVDPDGELAQLVAGVIAGAIFGAGAGIVGYFIKTRFTEEKFTFKGMIGAATSGAITGAATIVSVATAGLINPLIIQGAAGAIGYAAESAISEELITPEGLITSAVIGGTIGYVTGRMFPFEYDIITDTFIDPVTGPANIFFDVKVGAALSTVTEIIRDPIIDAVTDFITNPPTPQFEDHYEYDHFYDPWMYE